MIVSIDIRNQYSATVLVVPFSSDVESSRGNPCRVVIAAGEGGLEKESIALCDLITSIEKRYLERGPYGQLSADTFAQIQQGIQRAIGMF